MSGLKNFRMNFGVNQRVQVKLDRKGTIQKLDNLIGFNTVGSYNFLWKEQGQIHPLSNLNTNLYIQPPGGFNLSASGVVDVYSERPLRSFGFNYGFNLNRGRKRRAFLPLESTGEEPGGDIAEDWSLDFAYSYSGGYSGRNWASSKYANIVAHFQLTPSWTFDYSAGYDVTLRQVGTQHFGLTRDLHCWTASFSRTFDPDGFAEYYFRIGVKDQKEIFLERGTRGGSLGGIQ